MKKMARGLQILFARLKGDLIGWHCWEDFVCLLASISVCNSQHLRIR